MAVIVVTDKPKELLVAIYAAIKSGHVATWGSDADGDFTHTADQWNRRAWFRPTVAEEKLIFNIIPPQNVVISSLVYGVFHGRLVEMLLVHFDKLFEKANATAMPTVNDRIGKRT